MNTLGDKIKKARTNKGISIRELAKVINVDNSGLAKIENGKVKKPGYLILRRICSELNLDELKLMELAGYTKLELDSLLNTKVSIYKGIEDSPKINKYKSLTDNGIYDIDIIKVLKGYKSSALSEGETIALIMCRIGLPLDNYISKKDLEKYKINNYIEEWKEKNE